jgi:hypothetical protein
MLQPESEELPQRGHWGFPQYWGLSIFLIFFWLFERGFWCLHLRLLAMEKMKALLNKSPRSRKVCASRMVFSHTSFLCARAPKIVATLLHLLPTQRLQFLLMSRNRCLVRRSFLAPSRLPLLRSLPRELRRLRRWKWSLQKCRGEAELNLPFCKLKSKFPAKQRRSERAFGCLASSSKALATWDSCTFQVIRKTFSFSFSSFVLGCSLFLSLSFVSSFCRWSEEWGHGSLQRNQLCSHGISNGVCIGDGRKRVVRAVRCLSKESRI